MIKKNFLNKIVVTTLVLTMLSTGCNVYAATNQSSNKTQTSQEVLKAGINIDIKPIYTNLTESQTVNLVRNVGNKLVAQSSINKSITFNVIDKEEVNAYADLKNSVNVYTGILKYVESEDELAAIIGHEIGHITHNHVIKTSAKGTVIGATVATGLGRVLSSATRTSGLVMLGTGAIAGVANQTWTRNYETTADLAGIDYMVKAGYNPLAAISIMNKISEDYFDILSNHPSGDKRVTKEYNYIKKNYPQYIENGYFTDAYASALSKIEQKNSKKNKTTKTTTTSETL